MTPTEIQNVIAAKSAELNDHVKDVELLARLQAAPDNKARLQRELATLTAQLNDAYAAEETVKREALRVGTRNVSVAVKSGDGLHTVYHITYERPVYCPSTRENPWTFTTINGFANLPPEVMRYILTFAVDALPSLIRQLDPADPFNAMDLYLQAKRRGRW